MSSRCHAELPLAMRVFSVAAGLWPTACNSDQPGTDVDSMVHVKASQWLQLMCSGCCWQTEADHQFLQN